MARVTEKNNHNAGGLFNDSRAKFSQSDTVVLGYF